MNRALIGWLIPLAERGALPDSVIRLGIRRLSQARLARDRAQTATERTHERQAVIERLKSSALAEATREANEQHYELPPEFFGLVLGQHRKYSSCWFGPDTKGLDEAEALSLAASAEHAALTDGQRVLELGCGWGSFSLWMAARYPRSTIVSVSNSAPQRGHILAEAERRGISNLEVRTADINTFDPGARFDRIVSIEMFEHVRNHERLFQRLHDWLVPGGRLFVHVFRHERLAYTFEDADRADWMTRHFFTGGIMPSHDLLPSFAGPLELEEAWRWDGTHYQRTAEAWLKNIDQHRTEVREVFARVYGPAMANRWIQRWRIFFMACAELFGYDRGREWGVSHYRWRRPE